MLVVVPEEAFSEEELNLASADGFVGLIGPFVNGSCILRGARRAELQSEVQVLIVDLGSDTLGDPGRRCARSLHREQPQRADGLRGGQGPLALAFGRRSSAPRGALPQAGLARSLAPQPQFSVHDRRRGASVSVRPDASLGTGAAAGLCGFRCVGLASGGLKGSGARSGDLADGPAVDAAGHRARPQRGGEPALPCHRFSRRRPGAQGFL